MKKKKDIWPEFEEVLVPPSRLADGVWKDEAYHNRGDIRASYSADKIPDGKVRKPFRFRGRLWVATGFCTSHGIAVECKAWPLTPAEEFGGQVVTYYTKPKHLRGYEGIAVIYNSENYVIDAGPIECKPGPVYQPDLFK